jgi:hypothetical protein
MKEVFESNIQRKNISRNMPEENELWDDVANTSCEVKYSYLAQRFNAGYMCRYVLAHK